MPSGDGAHEGDFGAVGEWCIAVGLLSVDEGPGLFENRQPALITVGDGGEEIDDRRAVRHLELLSLAMQHVPDDAVISDGNIHTMLSQRPASERTRRWRMTSSRVSKPASWLPSNTGTCNSSLASMSWTAVRSSSLGPTRGSSLRGVITSPVVVWLQSARGTSETSRRLSTPTGLPASVMMNDA